MLRHAQMFVAFVMLAALGACATTPSGQRLERLAVQVGVMSYIERSSDPAKTALRVLAAVEKTRTQLDFAEVVVGDLRGALLARVAERLELSPAERLVALEVINATADEVERRVGSGVLSADARVTVNQVLKVVEVAARTYVPY